MTRLYSYQHTVYHSLCTLLIICVVFAHVWQGVGPATASAVLAAACAAQPSGSYQLLPAVRACGVFMSDELLRASGCKKNE